VARVQRQPSPVVHLHPWVTSRTRHADIC
jgi:hypothetical protein